MFMNIANVNGQFERDGSSAHNEGTNTGAIHTLAQENEIADTLSKSPPVMITESLDEALRGLSAEQTRAGLQGAHWLGP